MTMRVRAAEPGDAPAIAALLIEDALVRQSLDPALWAVAPDAEARVRASLATIAEPVTGPVRHHWIVAENGGGVVAVSHAVNLPPPPIIDLAGGSAGVLLDDCHFAADAAVSSALLQASEQATADAGAVLFVAASPSGWSERTRFLNAAGYETTTLYMAKSGFADAAAGAPARPATTADVGGIVRLSALHRARLQAANPLFWNIHPDADERFAGWMAASLGFPDRAMFVSDGADGADGADGIDGYIIAQPGSPLHLPPAHDAGRIGLIDDFYAAAFEPGGSGGAGGLDHAAALLAAAEAAFHGRGIDTALAICPARMTAKADLLRSRGYASANLWMVKARSRQ